MTRWTNRLKKPDKCKYLVVMVRQSSCRYKGIQLKEQNWKIPLLMISGLRMFSHQFLYFVYWPLVFAKHIPVYFGLISLVTFFVAEFVADKLARKRFFADFGIQ